MTAPNVIHVNVSGITASGKTAILSRIRKALELEGYCCASPHLDAENRMRSPDDIRELAIARDTVVILSESNVPRPSK